MKMKSFFKFLSRIVGLRHIKFTKSGIFLFEFPMFLIPIETYLNTIERFNKEIGEEKTREKLQKIGISQGKFSVNYFKKKFNLFFCDDLSFYMEQSQSVGLGEFKLLKVKNNSAFTYEYTPSYYVNEKFKDYYLEGILLGMHEIVFEEKFSISHHLVSPKKVILKLEASEKNSLCKGLQSYCHSSISSTCKDNKQNPQFAKTKIKNKNLFYSGPEGTFFDNEKYIFTLNSVAVMFYYELLQETKRAKEIFEKSAKEFAYTISKKYSYRLKSKDDFSDIFALFGYENITFIMIKKQKIIAKLSEGSFEKIAKNLYPDQYTILNNEFKIGLIAGFFETLFKTKYTHNIISKTNRYIIVELFEKSTF